MNVWAILNALFGIIACVIVTLPLVIWHDRLSSLERIGMGLITAGLLMTVAPTLWDDPTPYEEWAGALLRIGLALYFIGRMLCGVPAIKR